MWLISGGSAIAFESGRPIGCRCKGDLLHATIIDTADHHDKTDNYEERDLISASLSGARSQRAAHCAELFSRAVPLKENREYLR